MNYLMFDRKKVKDEDQHDFMKALTLIGNPQLYQALYGNKQQTEKSEPFHPEELHDLDRLLKGLEEGRVMTAVAFGGEWI